MSIFEKLMSLIEQYGEGEAELEDIILFGGLEIPYHVMTERMEDYEGNVHEHEYIEYDYKEHGEPPENMTAVYQYLHEKQIDKSAEIKAMQAMYKA